MKKPDKEEARFALDALAEQAAEIAGSLNREAPTVAAQVTSLAEMIRELAKIVAEVIDVQPEA